jgi:hypothetical protein
VAQSIREALVQCRMAGVDDSFKVAAAPRQDEFEAYLEHGAHASKNVDG